MSGNPFRGAFYLVHGLRLIARSGIRRFVLIPLLVNTILFGLLIWYGASQFNQLIDWLLPEWLDWLAWILWPLFAVTGLLVAFYTFTLAANLIAAPFNGLLAEAVEKKLRGGVPTAGPSSRGWGAEIAGALGSELKKLRYFLARAVPLLILFLIPGLNIAAPLLWLIFTVWMLALEYADFPMGNHGLPFADQRARLRQRGLTVLGFGAATLLLTLIPFLNFIAVPAGVAGATVLWVEEFARRE